MKFFISLTDENGILLDKFEVMDSHDIDLPDSEKYEGEFIDEPASVWLLKRLEREIDNAKLR